jgi:hypothetical protein
MDGGDIDWSGAGTVKDKSGQGHNGTPNYPAQTVPSTANLYERYTLDPTSISGATVSDSSGNNRTASTTGSPPSVAGQIGGALSFDGSTQWIRTPSFVSSNASSYTTAAWIYRTSNSEHSLAGIFWAADAGVTNQLGLRLGDGCSPAPATSNTIETRTTGSNCVDTGLVVPLNTWTFVAVTSSSTGFTMYLGNPGGSLQTFNNSTANSVLSVADPMRVGADPVNDVKQFIGYIDEARWYSAWLSPSDITILFNYTGVGTIATSTTPGRVGQALNFDGIGDYVNVGSGGSTVNSVSLWMRAATSTASSSIMALSGTAEISVVSGVIKAPGFTSPTIYVDNVVTTTLNDANWHHVVVTTGTNINASAVTLGKIGTNYFGGSLDDVRMYSRVLLPSEVQRLYKLGK